MHHAKEIKFLDKRTEIIQVNLPGNHGSWIAIQENGIVSMLFYHVEIFSYNNESLRISTNINPIFDLQWSWKAKTLKFGLGTLNSGGNVCFIRKFYGKRRRYTDHVFTADDGKYFIHTGRRGEMSEAAYLSGTDKVIHYDYHHNSTKNNYPMSESDIAVHNLLFQKLFIDHPSCGLLKKIYNGKAHFSKYLITHHSIIMSKTGYLIRELYRV